MPLAVFAGYGLLSFPGLWASWQVSSIAPLFVTAWIVAAILPLMLLRHARPAVTVSTMAALAIALRIAVVVVADGRIPLGDARNYVVLAQHLIEGRGLVIVDHYMGVEVRALYPPVYPILLAGWGATIGFSTASLTLLATIVDLATAGAMVLLARMLGNRSAGIAAAWLYLIWPSVLLSAPLAQKEGVCALLAVLLAIQWIRLAAKHDAGAARWYAAVALGVTAGVLTLTQPGQAPLVMLFGLVSAAVCGWRRAVVAGLRAVPFAILVILLPWWIRNALIFGAFVPLTSAGGYGLWIGNNPDATGHWMPPPPQLYGMPEIAFGKAAAALAIDWIVQHPADFLRNTLAKAVRGWGVAESGASRIAGLRPAIVPVIAPLALAVSQVAHLGLLAGAARSAWRRQTPGTAVMLLLVAACVVQTLVFGVWFEFDERHRDFATPFLLLLATFGFADRRAGPVGERLVRMRLE
ncbi:glycosyltransferase [Sphingomonas sp. UV9]|uniref:glycosyltransferase n=1 Tax=Sphingomonas sp. UV9 TaxID=1851410 RepID=UPI000FFB531B|nr:glycosyltransferase [Sphingomonas sp. UV9]RXD05293.1 glycosyltransferase [Sphingomonas sp. UV9]